MILLCYCYTNLSPVDGEFKQEECYVIGIYCTNDFANPFKSRYRDICDPTQYRRDCEQSTNNIGTINLDHVNTGIGTH